MVNVISRVVASELAASVRLVVAILLKMISQCDLGKQANLVVIKYPPKFSQTYRNLSRKEFFERIML